MTTKIPTWLPVFPGFYGTLFTPDCDLSEDVSERKRRGELPAEYEWWQGDNFDNAAYSLDVVKAACLAVFKMIPKEAGFVQLEFEEIRSPKEYNFDNDAVNIIAHVDPDVFSKWFENYLAKHAGDFAAYLKRRYSSRDGFISFYPNDTASWRETTAGWTSFGKSNSDLRSDLFGPHALGSILHFILTNENDEADLALYYRVSESVSPSCYLSQ